MSPQLQGKQPSRFCSVQISRLHQWGAPGTLASGPISEEKPQITKEPMSERERLANEEAAPCLNVGGVVRVTRSKNKKATNFLDSKRPSASTEIALDVLNTFR